MGGYNIDSIDAKGHNMAHLLVGSEGTLGFFTEIELDLQLIPSHRVLGVCHFPRFYQAMDATRHIVALAPTAVELDLGEEAEVPGNFDPSASSSRYVDLVQRMRDLGTRQRDEIDRRFPKLLRRVGGYNIDSIAL